MIDSHCHLDHEPLSNEINNIIKRSKENGIEKLLTICTTIESFKNIIKICNTACNSTITIMVKTKLPCFGLSFNTRDKITHLSNI